MHDRQSGRYTSLYAAVACLLLLGAAGCHQSASAPEPPSPPAPPGKPAPVANIGMKIQQIESDPNIPPAQKAKMIAEMSQGSAARPAPHP